jgi:hypothetical protein
MGKPGRRNIDPLDCVARWRRLTGGSANPMDLAYCETISMVRRHQISQVLQISCREALF